MKKLSRTIRTILAVLPALLILACAGTTRPPEAGAPGTSDQTYPIVYQGAPERVDEVKALWTSMLKNQGNVVAPLPELQPVTLTIKDISSPGVLRLQRLGINSKMTEDDIRESLRRFLDTARPLIGVEAQQLSFVDKSGGIGSSQVATYEQAPFRFPLRNGFGVVRVGFTQDLRIEEFSSTCIPNLQGFQRSLTRIKTTINAEQAVSIVQSSTLEYSDAQGKHQITVAAPASVSASQIILFPVRSPDNSSIALHLAWEVKIGGVGVDRTAYVDAVNSEVLATV